MKNNWFSKRVVLLGFMIICLIYLFNFIESFANESMSHSTDQSDPLEIRPRILERYPSENENKERSKLYSTGTTFNLSGDNSSSPLGIKQAIIYHLAKGKKACVVSDKSGGYSFVFVFDDFKETSGKLSLGENAHGWLLCHHGIEDEQILNYIWRGFLLEPKTSSVAYSLTGNLTLLKEKESVSGIILQGINTREPVKPDVRMLMNRGAALEHEITELKGQLTRNPDSVRVRFRLEQAQSELYHISDCLDEENMKPASVDGRVEVRPASDAPKYDVGPLL